MHKMYRSPHFRMITLSLKPGQNWRWLLFSGLKQTVLLRKNPVNGEALDEVKPRG